MAAGRRPGRESAPHHAPSEGHVGRVVWPGPAGCSIGARVSGVVEAGEIPRPTRAGAECVS
jgi:hypothetical protein